MKLLFLGFILISSMASASAGTRGGGDYYAQDFVRSGDAVLALLKKSYPVGMPPLDLQKLEDTINTTTVSSTNEKLFFNGQPKHAVFDSEKKEITINRDGWLQLGPLMKESLALHEYLGVEGIDDTKYQYSSFITDGHGSNLEIGEFKTYPDSDIADYDKLVAKLEATSEKNSEFVFLLNEIFTTYFGFSDVQYVHMKKYNLLIVAKIIATRLRDILPADFNSGAYVGVNLREVSATKRTGPSRIDRGRLVLQFDGDAQEVNFISKVDKNRYPTWWLIIGHFKDPLSSERFKVWMSTLINGTDDFPETNTNYDVPIR